MSEPPSELESIQHNPHQQVLEAHAKLEDQDGANLVHYMRFTNMISWITHQVSELRSVWLEYAQMLYKWKNNDPLPSDLKQSVDVAHPIPMTNNNQCQLIIIIN